MNKTAIRWIVLGVILLAVLSFYLANGNNIFSLENIQMHTAYIQDTYGRYPALFAGVFAILFVVSTALLVPIGTILTLIAGFIFETHLAIALVSLSSTVGVTFSVMTVRYLSDGFFVRRYGKRAETIQKNIAENGIPYLFALRLLPIFPFFLINIALGLTVMRLRTVFWVSLVGMLPGTVLYVYLGKELADIAESERLISPELLLLFGVVAILPLAGKKLLQHYRRGKKHRLHARRKKSDSV